MERNGDERIENDKDEAPKRKEAALLEKGWFVWAGVLLVLCGIVVAVIWLMPAKIDKVVEGFELGDRSAKFETVR